MKKLKNKMLSVLKNTTKNEVEKINYQWPPLCSGILHQPKRPLKEIKR